MALDTDNALTSLTRLKEYLGFGLATEQVVTIQFVKDTAGSLNDTYFYISSPTVDYYVWYNVNAGGTDPSIASRTGIAVAIATNATSAAVATATETAVDALAAFDVVRAGANIRVTNSVTGACSTPVDVDTGFNIILQAEGEDDDSTHDSALEYHINRASWYLNTMTGRKLLARALTEYYDGDASDTLLLNEYPVNSITSIYIDPGRSYGTDTLVSSDDYVLYGDEGMVKFDGSTGVGNKAVKVTYNAGYSTIPSDIEACCIQIASIDHYRETRKSLGLGSRTDASGQSMTFESGDQLVENVINKYKRKYR